MKELIISSNNNTKNIMLVENGILIEKYEENDSKVRLEGNIYIGRVQNVLPGMQAAFIDIGEKKNTFIHLKDILPKVDVVNDLEDVCRTAQKSENIKDYVKTGSNIVVQVKRDSTDKKGARVSTHISLPGMFLVFMPNTEIITISQKIEDKKERQRLLQIAKDNLPQNCGAIIRTAAYKKSDEDIKKDIDELSSKWESICEKVENVKKEQVPLLLCETDDLTQTFITSLMSQDLDKIIVNTAKLCEEIILMLEHLGLDSRINVDLRENEDLLSLYEIEEQVEDALKRKIWLKCGGFITIDATEALTAIDVNSGKYTGNTNLEQTVYTVNREATIEIAKQLRLKDIGGIIIIDYIDMKDESNRDKIIKLLTEELKRDRAKTQIEGFTKLNLLEMTRKHVCA